MLLSSFPRPTRGEQSIRGGIHLRLGPIGMPYMQKLVNDVGASQAPGVEDRRLAALVVGDNADQAVADPAELIADREGRDPLQFDAVGAQAEASLPLGEERVLAAVSKSDNESQSSLRVRRAASSLAETPALQASRRARARHRRWRQR
jgi:hypothetical protein